MVNGFDDFLAEIHSDESIDLAWLDNMHHSKQIARLLENTDANPLLCELGMVCNDVLGVDQIVSTGEKTSTRFRSGKSLELVDLDIVEIVETKNDNPAKELREELFVAMLEKNLLVSPENFERFLALDNPLDFETEKIVVGTKTTEVYLTEDMAKKHLDAKNGKAGYVKLTERIFKSAQELAV